MEELNLSRKDNEFAARLIALRKREKAELESAVCSR